MVSETSLSFTKWCLRYVEHVVTRVTAEEVNVS